MTCNNRWLQDEVRVELLGQEPPDPHLELLVLGEDLGHEVGLLEAGRQEVVAARLPGQRTVADNNNRGNVVIFGCNTNLSSA